MRAYRPWICYCPVKTTQERRLGFSEEHKPYIRAKRRSQTLPDSWNDKYVGSRKCWKDRRKTQYRDTPRGAKHSLVLDGKSWRESYEMEEYFKIHDIPYRIQRLTKLEEYTVVIKSKTERVMTCSYPFVDSKGIARVGYIYRYLEVPLEKPIVKTKYKKIDLGYEIIWWSDKDIGVDYILGRVQL